MTPIPDTLITKVFTEDGGQLTNQDVNQNCQQQHGNNSTGESLNKNCVNNLGVIMSYGGQRLS